MDYDSISQAMDGIFLVTTFIVYIALAYWSLHYQEFTHFNMTDILEQVVSSAPWLDVKSDDKNKQQTQWLSFVKLYGRIK